MTNIQGSTGMAMPAAAAGDDQAAASAGDYLALLKPRVMSLVVFTALVGMVVAAGPAAGPAGAGLHPILWVTALLCIAVGAGASGAINMWYDADIDALMSRTRLRPIPRGLVSSADALGFGIVLSIASVTVMALTVNLVAAALLALTIGFYVLVYTMWRKRRTPQNIVIGGAAGALPPVIGWAAVTGQVDIYPLILFGLIFLWTPPHFWALALYRSGDYARAKVPMLPVVAGAAATRHQILGYALVLAPFAVLPSLLGYAGWLYGGGAILLGTLFLALALRVWLAGDDGGQGVTDPRPAKQLFAFSILYLFLLFALLLVERLVPGAEHIAPLVTI
ncbi:MAG: heme o synthase [Sneathiellaceae bacterium]